MNSSAIAIPGGGSATVVPFDQVVVMRGSTLMNWIAGAAPCVLVHHGYGPPNPHVDGAQRTYMFPANTVTSIQLPAEINAEGLFSVDAAGVVQNFDPTLGHALMLVQKGGVTFAILRTFGARDTTGPSVSGVTCSHNNPDAVVVNFNEPVAMHGSVAGFALTNAGGRTITAVEAGDGSTSVTLTVSSAFVGTETPSLVVGAGVVASDLSDNPVQASTTAVSMSFLPPYATAAAWTQAYDASYGVAQADGLLTAWTDLISGTLQIVPESSGAPAVSGGAIVFTGNANQRCKVAAVPTTGTDFALHARMNDSAFGDGGYLVCFDKDGAAVDTYIQLNDYFQTQITGDCYEGASAAAQDAAVPAGAAYHDVFLSRAGTSLTLQVDGRAAVTVTNSKDVTGLLVLALGCRLYNGAIFGSPGIGGIKLIGFKANAAWAAGEITAIRAIP